LGELLTIHLELRENVRRELGVEIVADSSVEKHFARSDEMRRQRREALLNRNIIKAFAKQSAWNREVPGSDWETIRRER
jgi:hypothetical protein